MLHFMPDNVQLSSTQFCSLNPGIFSSQVAKLLSLPCLEGLLICPCDDLSTCLLRFAHVFTIVIHMYNLCIFVLFIDQYHCYLTTRFVFPQFYLLFLV